MNANHLLLWLSHRREGSWGQFRSGVDQFADEAGAAGSSGSGPGATARLPLHQRCRLNLRRLAHVEFHGTNGAPSWRVAPPALAINEASGGWRGIVCGARWPRFGEQLKASLPAAVRLEVSPQPVAPDAYLLEAADAERLSAAASELGLAAQANASLALLVCVAPISQRLPRHEMGLPHGSDWDINRFSARDLQWVPSDRRAAELEGFGLYQFIFRHERRYFLCARGKAYRVANQIGKYLVLRKRRRSVLRYDPAAQALSIPAICQPPPLIERALILCSGSLPRLDDASHSLGYSCVGRELAQAAAILLGQRMR